MNRHRWRYSPGTSGIGRPSPSWAFQRSKTTQMNIELPFFHYSDSTCHLQQSSSVRATTLFGFLRNSLKYGYPHRPSIFWTAGNPSRGAVTQPVCCEFIWRDLQRSAHQVIALEHVDVKSEKMNESKRTVGRSPKSQLEATETVNTRTLCRRMNCGKKWNTIAIHYSPLNTLSCSAACKAIRLIEHSSCDVIGLHHSSIQKLCRFLGSWVCQDKQCYNPYKPRPLIMHLRKIINTWSVLTELHMLFSIWSQNHLRFQNPRAK